MQPAEKLKALKALPLFSNIPEESLPGLAAHLADERRADGEVVFEEGSTGDALYFVASGRVRIQKSVLDASGKPGVKDLAILDAGDCFGEMALFERAAPRSARAQASGETVLFALGRAELLKWLESNPSLAVGFLTELVQLLSKRLRRSSNELTLLFDLSQWLLEPVAGGKELLAKVLRHLVPHLEGRWSAGAYLYNPFNEELELVATEGGFTPPASGLPGPKDPAAGSAWPDPKTCVVSFPGPRQSLQGYLVFRAAAEPSPADRTEAGRALTTVARLIASALENIAHRSEESMRARLAESRTRGAGI